jgi:PAS domain S-box-containing protein
MRPCVKGLRKYPANPGFSPRPYSLVGCVAALLVCSALAGAHAPVEFDREPILLLADRDYPPLSYLDRGTASGLDVDLARALSEKLRREVRVNLMDWDVAQQHVLAGKADGLLSMTMLPERRLLFDFTDPVITHDFGIFVRRGNLTVHGRADLQGKRIGVTRGGLPRHILESEASHALVYIHNYEDGFKQLAAGTLDAVAADRWVGSYTIEHRGLRNIVATGPPFAALLAGIAVRKGQTALAGEINAAVHALKSDGTLAQIQERWRPQEMLFVSRQRVDHVVRLVAGGSLAAMLAALALWTVTTAKQARTRRAVEAALVHSEQRLRQSQSTAETDIIERKQVEDRVRLLAHALQRANDCVSITDPSDHILYVNEAFLRTYEYGEEELLGQHISIIRSENDPAVVEGMRAATVGQGWRGTLWNRSKTGRVFPVSLATSVVHDERGAVVAAVGIARDTTREMAADEALRRTEIKYRDVVENANDVIFTVDRAGYCLSMNRAGRQITGYVAEHARGVHLSQLVAAHHAAFAWQQLDRVLAGETIPTFELEIVNREGRRLTLELDVHPLHDEGTRIGAQGIARDVTVRKELETQLRQAQKMEAIGRLAGGIAHDFNNVLTIIVGYAELIGDQLPPEDAIRADLSEIQRAADSAQSLTRQLLIFSRKDVVRPAVLDLNDIVRSVERMLRRVVGEDIEFIVRRGHNLGCIRADGGQIEQVIMNLVVNARDAMPTGGMLSVETAATELDEHAVRSIPGWSAGRFVTLTVTDTGHGMTPDVQAQIFTPFFTTKGPSIGTGLGLATVHGIVQQAGGWIDVDSAPGKGTRFSIYLPEVAEPCDVADRSAATSTPGAAASGTILFVEDDESIRALGTRALRKHGFTVLPARHAKDALQLAEDPDRRIDLLLTDVVMPGMSGHELAGRLRQFRPEVKVLYTSGYTDDGIALRDVPVNGPEFIQKPYSPESLVRRVRAAFGGSA